MQIDFIAPLARERKIALAAQGYASMTNQNPLGSTSTDASERAVIKRLSFTT
jgi:hypothetical protein